jgi:hypothetical protein
MIRELNGNKYLVEKTLYGDVMIDISDDDDDDLLNSLKPSHTLKDITDKPELETNNDYLYDTIDRQSNGN